MKIYGTESNIFIMREIGKRIQDTRISISLTQKEMAVKAGISSRTVERIENGENVKLDNILNVLRVLNLLKNMEILVPEQEVMPTVLHDYGKKRMRATSKKANNHDKNEWKWGDEK